MRLLHTSDWHLGRSFHDVGLLSAQAEFLDHLVDAVRSESVDAVLVSGDVYDRALPAPDTVALLSDTMSRIIDAGAQVVLSSGNHDSAIRLGFASQLLARAGLHIRTSVADIDRPVQVGDVCIYPLPYLEPSLVADPLGAKERSHAGVLAAAMDRVRRAHSARPGAAVLMAHAFATGAQPTDSERDITVGGVASVPADTFVGVDYVALGHLHRAQQLTETIRYSGSPLAMSFSEAGQVKGSWMVDINPRGKVRAEFLAAPVARPLALLRGELADLLSDPDLAYAQSAWCRVTLTDASRPVGAMEALRGRFPHTLELLFEPPVRLGEQRSYAARAKAATSALTVCCDFVDHVRGGNGATDTERALFVEALEGTRLQRSQREDEGRVDSGSELFAAPREPDKTGDVA
ncbi:MAG: exonuclease SbcCD subunit D [Nostocoides sp.]